MIDTIIYDMGNVLIEWNPEKFLHLIETDEERIAKLRTAIFTSGYWPRQDTGELDADKAYHMSLALLDEMTLIKKVYDKFIIIGMSMQMFLPKCKTMRKN